MKTTHSRATIFPGVGTIYLLCVSVFALFPSSGKAQCGTQWLVTPHWVLKQSDGIPVDMNLTQDGTKITGWASYKNATVQGSVSGAVEGDKFNVRVSWLAGNVGGYKGTILPSGIISGRCSDENAPSYKATFVSNRPMYCKPTPAPNVTENKGPKVFVTILRRVTGGGNINTGLSYDFPAGTKCELESRVGNDVVLKCGGTRFTISVSDTSLAPGRLRPPPPRAPATTLP